MTTLKELIEKIKASKEPIKIAQVRDALSYHGFNEQPHARDLTHVFIHETMELYGDGLPLTPRFRHGSKKEILEGKGGSILTPKGKQVFIAALEAALELQEKDVKPVGAQQNGNLEGGLNRDWKDDLRREGISTEGHKK